MKAQRIPPNFFGIPFGLTGLGGTWLAVSHSGNAPQTVSTVVFGAAALVWFILVAGYLRFAFAGFSVIGRDLTDPVAAPFTSLALITPVVLAAQAVYPHHAVLGRVLVDVFLVLVVILGSWLTGQWIYAPLDVDQIHPGYFLPTVAGGLLAAAAAATVGQQLLGFVAFGLGLTCWLVLGSIMLGRLMTRPLPPAPLLPTIAIEIAPAAVASLAWFALHGDRIDAVAAGFGGYGVLMVLAQIRLLPSYVRLPFMPSTWSFTFSLAAVGNVIVHWLEDLRPAGHIAWEYAALAVVTAVVGAIGIRTIVALVRRQLLPAERASGAPGH